MRSGVSGFPKTRPSWASPWSSEARSEPWSASCPRGSPTRRAANSGCPSCPRRQEMAVRLALGASASRLARGLFAESLLLSILGGAAGLLAARIGVPLLVILSPEDVPRLHDAAVDGRVLAFSLAACLAAAVLSGLGPMLLALRSSLETTFREGSPNAASGPVRLR